MKTPFQIQRLQAQQAYLMPGLQAMFGKAFGEEQGWSKQRPDAAYLEKLLNRPDVFVIAAVTQIQGISVVVGGLVAYALQKIEQPRSEIYIYDLAVDEAHRRQGIATALIEALQPMARDCGAWVMYVQADYGDEPAIALYNKLGVMEEVMHFDIPVQPATTLCI
jgi:aminoglycoside 3-N-acetyltransferase I